VEWKRVDLPRTAVKQDLLFTLGSAMSIFSPSKNNAVARLEHLLATGGDQGQFPGPGPHDSNFDGREQHDGEDVDQPEITTDIEQVAYDQITARISEEFAGHALATLVTDC